MMKKIFLMVALLLIAGPGEARDLNCTKAKCIRADTTNFDGNLSGTDTRVQSALETLDDMVVGVGDFLADGTVPMTGALQTSHGSILADATASGILTLGGVGGTNNENLTFDFETTADMCEISTSTGITAMSYDGDFAVGVDAGTGNRTIPTHGTDDALWAYSADTTQNSDYIKMYHDQTDGNIASGAGDLNLIPASGNIEFRTANTSSDITDFTQGLTIPGIHIVGDYVEDDYGPGIFWSTQNNNPTKPMAGIWTRKGFGISGSEIHIGVSDTFATGITGSLIIKASTILQVKPGGGFISSDAAINNLVVYNSGTGNMEFETGYNGADITFKTSIGANDNYVNQFTMSAEGDFIIGSGTAGTDYSLKFDGEDSEGVITWMEDEDRFDFADAVLVNGFHSAITTKTDTDYTATINDDIILVSTGATTRTISFAAASTLTGKIYHIKKIDSGVGLVTLDPNSTETIDGDQTPDITGQYGRVMLVSDGSNWHIL